SVSMEMATGFRALRNACPMNIRRPVRAIAFSDDIFADVKRIEAIFAEALKRSGGPFLFGDFCAADAMFAPVVNRLEAYAIPVTKTTRTYMDAVKALPAWKKWEKAALAETWIVEEDEA
ncbi:MAG: gst13, partial [Pseudomonadota bacterium]